MPSAESPASPETTPSTAAEPVKPSAADQTSKPSAESATAGPITLSPDNTKIEFVGTHVGTKPDPRVGSFAKFAGKMEVDAAAKRYFPASRTTIVAVGQEKVIRDALVPLGIPIKTLQ